jgi:hypothetical protein
VTVNVNTTLCAPEDAVPVTVTGYDPTGVDPDVTNVIVDEPPALTDTGLNDTATPDGNPEADNDTDCADPDVTAVNTDTDTDPPAATEPDDGDTDTEKSLPAGLLVIWLKIFEYAQPVALS